MRPRVIAPTEREARAIGNEAVACPASDAARVIDELRRSQPFDVLVIAGVCGGLDPSLPPGSIILARAVATVARDDLVPDTRGFSAARRALRGSNARFVSSKMLTLERPAASRAVKTALWNTYGAGGVDMETYQLATLAEEQGVPWLALRAVLDSSCSSLPASLREWSADASERAIALHAARRPWEWPAVARLAWQMRAACQALCAALDVALPALEALPAEAKHLDVVGRVPLAALDVSVR